jgi:phage gp29-like protein
MAARFLFWTMKLSIPVSSLFARRSIAAAMALDAAKPTPPAESFERSWIHGRAQERWLTPGVRFYTPQMVELILRGAVAGDIMQQMAMFDLMEETWPRLSANLKKLREKACSIEWYVQPWAAKGKKPSAEAERRAALFEDAIWNMRPSPVDDENEFEGTVFDILDAWGKGVSVLEILWTDRQHDSGTLIVPRATRWVPPDCYGYDGRGVDPGRLKLRAQAMSPGWDTGEGDWVEFAEDKFLVATAKQKSGSPVSGAMLRLLGFFWAAQNFSWEWFLNFTQIFGMPIRMANYSSTASGSTIAQIEQMLANMGSAAWAAFPEGTKIQILEAIKTSAEGPHERLNSACDTICDILILGQTLTSDVGSSGSRALGDVHQQVLSVREQAVARFAARVLNSQLAPAFCRLNFGDDSDCPYLVPDIEAEEDTKKVAETLEVARRIGVEIPVAFVHEKLAIPMAKDGEPILPPLAAPAANPGAPVSDPAANSGAPVSDPADSSDDTKAGDKEPAKALRAARAEGRDALAAQVAEDVTGIAATWLKGALPWFKKLIEAAEDPGVSDAEFERLLERARQNLPEELGALLDTESLALAMEKAMGASVVNGYVQAAIKRKVPAGK